MGKKYSRDQILKTKTNRWLLILKCDYIIVCDTWAKNVKVDDGSLMKLR